AHATAGVAFETDLAGLVPDDADREVVPAQRGAVGRAGDHGDLELARQVAEFRHERGHLPDHLRPRAGVHDLVVRGTGILVGRDVADRLPAGLDRVHLDFGQLGEDVGRFFELDPVVLDVLPGGEMPVAAI